MPHDEDKTQRHYALMKLEESARTITQAISELPVSRKRLEKCRDDKPKALGVCGKCPRTHLHGLGRRDPALTRNDEPPFFQQAVYKQLKSRPLSCTAVLST